MRSRLLPLTLAAAAALLAGAGISEPALAVASGPVGDECELIRSTYLSSDRDEALADVHGTTIAMGAGSGGGYATIWDGGPGPMIGDAWNNFGQLYVGASPSNAARYTDANLHGCSRSMSGRQVDFATRTIDGLQVRRSMLVASALTPGVRILDTLTNPTAAPITTSVWVGDLLDSHADGLGSDEATTIRSTSSGDASLSAADHWAVTTDDAISVSDPAIAHIWGGPGASTPATLVRSGAQSGARPLDNASGTLAAKQFGWAWQNVTIAPGASARFLSWEVARTAPSRSWVDQAPLAAASANELTATTSATQRLAGLTPSQIATIRNWAPPTVTGSILTDAGATTTADTVLRAVGVDFGALEHPACTDGTLRWDFGDGATASGATVQHRFGAGMAQVELTIEGACGGRATRTMRFEVSAPTAPVPSPTPAPASALPAAEDPAASRALPAPTGPVLRLFGPPSVKTTTLASSHGLVVGVQASVDGDVRLVLTGTGVKSVKSAALKAGVTSFVKVQLDPSARRAALTLKTIRLRAKLTPRAGGEVVENLTLKLRR